MRQEGVAAVVPAAGVGRRLGRQQTKAFVRLTGQPLLLHTLQALDQAPSIRWIIVAVRSKDRRRLAGIVRRARLKKVTAIVQGGSSRSASVVRGMAALPSGARWVMIHDGARPCLSQALIERVIRHARRAGAVACGLPASLTVKAVDEHRAVRLTLDRGQLWLAQTPQVFRRDWLEEAVRKTAGRLDQFPDDAALLEWAGFPVQLIPGEAFNIKVTTPMDLHLAEAILRNGWRHTQR